MIRPNMNAKHQKLVKRSEQSINLIKKTSFRICLCGCIISTIFASEFVVQVKVSYVAMLFVKEYLINVAKYCLI